MKKTGGISNSRRLRFIGQNRTASGVAASDIFIRVYGLGPQSSYGSHQQRNVVTKTIAKEERCGGGLV
jgi:hypothetical protein